MLAGLPARIIESACRSVTGHSGAELESCLLVFPVPQSANCEALNDKQSKARGLVTKYNGVDVLASPLRFY